MVSVAAAFRIVNKEDPPGFLKDKNCNTGNCSVLTALILYNMTSKDN